MNSLSRLSRYVLFLALVSACNGANEPKGGGKKSGAGSGSGTGAGTGTSSGSSDDDDSGSSGDGSGSKGSGTATGSASEPQEVEEEEADDDDDTAAAEAEIAKLLADCGGSDAAKAGPNDVIYERSVTSLPIVKNLLIASITATTKLDVRVTGSQAVQTSLVTIGKVEIEFIKTLADKSAAENSGTVTLTNVPIAKYSELSKDKIYEGVVCTVVPATAIENGRGGKKTIVAFDPPVPTAISPRAVAARYVAELGKSHVFSGIKATIKESTHEALAGKKEITGTVTVTAVAASMEVDDGKGGKLTLKGDTAYEMFFAFESPAVTFALGLPPKVTFFINHTKKDLAANVVDTAGLENGGMAVFIYP